MCYSKLGGKKRRKKAGEEKTEKREGEREDNKWRAIKREIKKTKQIKIGRKIKRKEGRRRVTGEKKTRNP